MKILIVSLILIFINADFASAKFRNSSHSSLSKGSYGSSSHSHKK